MRILAVLVSLTLALPLAADGQLTKEQIKQLVKAKNDLKQLALGLMLYLDREGAYPPVERLLSTLYTSKTMVAVEIFQCPNHETKITAADLTAHRDAKLGYITRPWPLTSNNRRWSATPTIWTHTGVFPDNRRVVAFLDGHIETMSNERFVGLLAASAAEAKKGGQSMHQPSKPTTWAQRLERLKARAKQPRAEDGVDALMAGLDSRRYADREKAQLGLVALGEAAIPALMKALDDGSIEQKRAARALLLSLDETVRKKARAAALARRIARAK